VGNTHLGDDPHALITEQMHRGQRKRLKTGASRAKVPLSASLASWLAELRPEGASPDAPVFASKTAEPLSYDRLYHGVLRPALIKAGLAVRVGEDAKGRPVWDFQGVGFHAFRRAAGSLLLAHGRTLKQVQGLLRHSQLTTTLNSYITQTDAGLGDPDIWDEILPADGFVASAGPKSGAGGSVTSEELTVGGVPTQPTPT
jgi:integrase